MAKKRGATMVRTDLEQLLSVWNEMDHTGRLMISSWMAGRWPEAVADLCELIEYELEVLRRG